MARAKKRLFHSDKHAINYCARSIAKKAVTEQLRDQGVRVTLVKPAEIAERAKVYLEEHPELQISKLMHRKRMSRNQSLRLCRCQVRNDRGICTRKH